MTDAPLGPFLLGQLKPKKWAHNPGPEVPTYTLANGTVAEIVAGIGLVWSTVANDFVLATIPTLKSARFSLSATGHVVPLVANKRIKVYAVKLVVSAAISVNFRDGASTLLEDPQAIAANGGFVESVQPPAFLFATTAGNDLDLVISGTGTAAGRISYWDDDAT